MKKQKTILWWVALLGGLVLVNILASLFHTRADLTGDKRYSLTPGSRDLLRQLEEPLLIEVFLTGDLPVEFRKLANATGEFLRVVKDVHPSHIHYRFIDPQEEATGGKIWADSLRSVGVEPINLSVQVRAGQEHRLVFPYAVVKYSDRSELVNLFQSSRRNISVAELHNAEATMEYQFARSVNRLLHQEKPTVVYAVGNEQPVGAETYDMVQQLGYYYNFHIFDLVNQPYIPGPDTIGAVLIVKPATPFSEAQKLKIDQYLVRGGKVIWFLDNLFAEEDSLKYQSRLIAYERNLDIHDLLFHYGVRVNPDLLMDLQCDFLPFAVGGSPQDPQYEFLRWNYYPLFESENNHPVNRNIGLVAGRYVNSVDTTESPGIRKTFLLRSSPNSRTISTPALISADENRNTAEDALFSASHIPAAVLVEGSFTSFFRARLGRVALDSLQRYGGFTGEGNGEGKMVVVADGDMVLNDVSPREGPLPMGMNLFTVGSQYEYQFANRDFLLNIMEYLTSSSSIIQARNKEIVLRLLDMRKVNDEKRTWQFVNIALPVILVILFGVLYQQVRRYRFAA